MKLEHDWRGIRERIASQDCETESELVARARERARIIHADDWRKDGSPYFSHCEAVEKFLKYFGADDETLAAAYLHDCVEDHPDMISFEDIEAEFGPEVRRIVDGATKFALESGEFGPDIETLKKVARSSTLDVRIALLKIADRWHNLSTMETGLICDASKRNKGDETLKFYIPFAKAFGLWFWASELGDLAYRYYDPTDYARVTREIGEDPRNQAGFKEEWTQRLGRLLAGRLIKGNIEVVQKGVCEMAEKRRRLSAKDEVGPVGFRDISDVVSFRLQLTKEVDIYTVVSLLMSNFGGVVEYSRTDDYIAHPADNGYRAFHLVLDLPQGLVEIAIMTEEMERFNRFGVLAKKWDGVPDWEKESKILVFTPREDLIVMNSGARVVDFAYRLSPILGLQMVAAIADGRQVSASEPLESGSSIEIVPATHTNLMPDLDHLMYCSPETAKIIKLQQERWERHLVAAQGNTILTKLLCSYGLMNIDDLNEALRIKILTYLNCRNCDDLRFKLGYSAEYVEEVVRAIQASGLVKEGVSYTTIEIEGLKDRPGLSMLLRQTIKDFGGNIINSVERVEEDNSFLIRVLMTGIKTSDKMKLRKAMTRYKVYRRVSVV